MFFVIMYLGFYTIYCGVVMNDVQQRTAAKHFAVYWKGKKGRRKK